MPTLQAVKGMNDLFEEELATWRFVEGTARELFAAFGYGEIRTPLVEEAEVFVRGIGEGTDIVGKEMFLFSDRDPKKPKQLCLRPENTAGVVRAMIEGGKLMADAAHKLAYLGPMFRNERPQAGRYRQFHQLGAEAFGYDQPSIDVEVVALVHALLQRLGIADAVLHINSLGDAADRPRYREALAAYFAPHKDQLSAESQRRFEQNPLRILDSKDEGDRALAAGAPKPRAFLSDASRAHFDAVCTGLTRLDVPFVVDDQLVRGLDYYTRTVFEFVGGAGLGAQSTIAAGGRYDGLVEELGGRGTPAVGFAAGIERLVLVLQAHKLSRPPPSPTLVLIGADDDGRAACERIAYALRRAGVRVDVDHRGRSVKAQIKSADRQGALFVAVVGKAEVDAGRVDLKQLANGSIASLPLDAATLQTALATAQSAAPPAV